LEYLAFSPSSPKNQQAEALIVKNVILHMYAAPHPFVTQCTDQKHIPISLHEEQKPT
jgi:hypothetical protein